MIDDPPITVSDDESMCGIERFTDLLPSAPVRCLLLLQVSPALKATLQVVPFNV